MWIDENEKECPSNCGHDLSTQKSNASKNNNISSVTSTLEGAKPSALGGSIGSGGFSFRPGSGEMPSAGGFSFGNSNIAGKSPQPAATGGFNFQANSEVRVPGVESIDRSPRREVEEEEEANSQVTNSPMEASQAITSPMETRSKAKARKRKDRPQPKRSSARLAEKKKKKK